MCVCLLAALMDSCSHNTGPVETPRNEKRLGDNPAGIPWNERTCVFNNMAMIFNGEPPPKWLVDINHHRNDAHQRIPG